MTETKQKDSIVVKSNRLIEASYRLTLQEQRILLVMISMIRPNDQDFKPYRFNVDDFKSMIGVTGDAYYKILKDLTKGLIDKGFVIPEPDGDLQVSWLSSAKYYDKKGYFELMFAPALKPYLLDIQKKFTLYQLRNVIRLRSNYSIRMYEILKRYQYKSEVVIKISDLRDFLGIEPGKYLKYNGLKKDVIEKTRKELTNKTDIKFSYSELKKGRRVTSLRFTITENPDNTPDNLPLPEPIPEHNLPADILELIPQPYRLQVAEMVAHYLAKEGKDYVKRNLAYTASKDYRNYIKYIESALKDDYGKEFELQGPTLLSKKDRELHEEFKKQEEAYQNQVKQRQLKVELEDRQRAMLKTLTPEQYAELTRRAIESLMPFDRRRFETAKGRDKFLPLVRNRLEMVEAFIDELELKKITTDQKIRRTTNVERTESGTVR